jgi:NAD-dependent SIR2 family protein deacetylase
MLHSRTGKLSRLYTQNIDGLDHQCTDLPSELIINVHGSISEASCEGCGRPVDDYRKFCDQVERQIKDIYCHNLQQQQESKERSKPQVQASPENPPHHPTESIPILCAGCGKPLVKPSTVLYGRKLPTRFWEHVQDDSRECDLLIVAGTSLEVAPANLIVRMVGDKCFRVVVNRERVGAHLGIDYRPDDPNRGKKPSRDCIAQGDADEVFLALIQELGWMDDLARKKELLPESSRLLLEREIAAGDSSRST